ncbi:hypothetical protein OUY22_20895 [Nonomuraea sp. MCN248]|uniref:Apolipoprotein N-acyltransferase n=1 Tax=Nonomuraea corallina TaxID=2989783 RepID=A0ABT4SF92_9ACTN|nr:hypothetical protein [Nonomuraea corallina]MDA0635886.1 hypothetical protein [Nonomuraea corallina]
MGIVARRVASWLGLAGHLGTLVPFYSSSGLMAPAWAVVALFAVWLVLLAAAIQAVCKRSPWGLLTPVVSLGLWWAAMSAGEAFLGWTG